MKHIPVVLGLDFGGTKIAVGACDITGRRLGSMTIETLPERGARGAFDRGVDAARRVLRDVAPDRALLAIGVSTIGIPGDHGVALAPAVPGWSDFRIETEVRRAFDVDDVVLATDVKAAAWAEADQGALRGYDPGIYVNLGTGLAVAIVVDGRVVRGRNGASGEIGYNLRSIADVGAGPSDRTPLEDVVSGRAFLSSALAVAPDALDAAGVFAQAAHDPQIAARVRAFVDELAFHIANLAIAIDPARIAVGGGMVRAWSHIEGGLRRALDAAVPYPPELVIATFPFDAPLIGALALGTAAARDRLTRGAPARAG